MKGMIFRDYDRDVTNLIDPKSDHIHENWKSCKVDAKCKRNKEDKSTASIECQCKFKSEHFPERYNDWRFPQECEILWSSWIVLSKHQWKIIAHGLIKPLSTSIFDSWFHCWISLFSFPFHPEQHIPYASTLVAMASVDNSEFDWFRISFSAELRLQLRRKLHFWRKSAGLPLFQNYSNINININIFECSQSRFRMIQPNDIISECKFTGCLDECQSSQLLVNVSIFHVPCHLSPNYARICSQFFWQNFTWTH
jgi:hypothetical protein